MSASAAVLYVAGGLLQIAGVLLVASPDIFPFLRRFARWLYPRYVRLENRLRRLVGRARPQRDTIGPADEINLADSLVPVLSPSKQLSLEETVAWLVRRAENAQKEHAALARRLEEAERAAIARADELQRHGGARRRGARRGAPGVPAAPPDRARAPRRRRRQRHDRRVRRLAAVGSGLG